MVRRKHQQPSLFKEPATVVVLTTRESETTRYVRADIPVGAIWHIRKSEGGIYLVDRTKRRGERVIHQLSTLEDGKISADTAFKVEPRPESFIVQYTRGVFQYSTDGYNYVPLTQTMQFMDRKEHFFRAGSLDFSLVVEERNN